MIDTQSKRLSIVNLGLPWRGIAAEPDGLFDRGDRLAFLSFYALAQVPVTGSANITLDGLTVESNSTSRIIASAAITLDGLVIVARAGAETVGIVDLGLFPEELFPDDLQD